MMVIAAPVSALASLSEKTGSVVPSGGARARMLSGGSGIAKAAADFKHGQPGVRIFSEAENFARGSYAPRIRHQYPRPADPIWGFAPAAPLLPAALSPASGLVLWHDSDLRNRLLFGRFRRQSGHQPAIAEQSRFDFLILIQATNNETLPLF
jgi:hypothetical protein